jgi:hypothetical protein
MPKTSTGERSRLFINRGARSSPTSDLGTFPQMRSCPNDWRLDALRRRLHAAYERKMRDSSRRGTCLVGPGAATPAVARREHLGDPGHGRIKATTLRKWLVMSSATRTAQR